MKNGIYTAKFPVDVEVITTDGTSNIETDDLKIMFMTVDNDAHILSITSKLDNMNIVLPKEKLKVLMSEIRKQIVASA